MFENVKQNKFFRGTLDIVNDPGVLFSGMHAIVFWNSLPVIAALGVGTLATTFLVNSQRKIFPQYTDKIAHVTDAFLKKIKAPGFAKPGLPLYVNGMALGGVGLVALATGQLSMAAISLSFALANAAKGSQISGGWGIKDFVEGGFQKIARHTPLGNKEGFSKFVKKLENSPSRFLNHTLYLPEFWAATGAFSVGILGSGMLVGVGASMAAVGIFTAGVNNNDPQNPAYEKKILSLKQHFDAVRGQEEGRAAQKIIVRGLDFMFDHALPVRAQGFVTKLATKNHDHLTPSDIVISRRAMKYASVTYGALAAINGHVDLTIAQFMAAAGNRNLEHMDLQKQRDMLQTMGTKLGCHPR